MSVLTIHIFTLLGQKSNYVSHNHTNSLHNTSDQLHALLACHLSVYCNTNRNNAGLRMRDELFQQRFNKIQAIL